MKIVDSARAALASPEWRKLKPGTSVAAANVAWIEVLPVLAMPKWTKQVFIGWPLQIASLA